MASVDRIDRMNRRLVVGILAALAVALIGSSWQLVTRHGVKTTLGPLELAVLRYGLPALLLSPIWLRNLRLPQGVRHGTLALLVIGGGAPFGVLVLAGAQWAPAAHMGVFMAGSVPLFTALGARAIRGENVHGSRLLGLICIAAGMAFFAVNNLYADASSWRGDALFVLAALLWACYSLAFAQSCLSPWQGAALVNAWSTLLIAPAILWFGAPKLLAAPWTDVMFQAIGQGVLAGMLGLAVYGVAIARLGAARASLSAALVPVITALGAAWLLNEPVTGGTLVALALLVPGVVLASGVWSGRAGMKLEPGSGTGRAAIKNCRCPEQDIRES